MQGARREVLRALCQLVNGTELTLEASLVEVEDADWQMVAARAGSVTGTFSADAVEEEVFENERFARGPGGSQWSAGNLAAAGDPRRFMYALHEADAFPQVCAKCPRQLAPGSSAKNWLTSVLLYIR